MNSDVKGFLNNLQEINNASTVSIKVPSIGKKVSFKLANVSQQKELLRSAFDGVDGVIKRANILNEIIATNNTGDVDFLIIDRPSILIGLRKESIGSEIKIGDETYNLADLPQVSKSDVKLVDVITEEDITVNVKVPTLALDTEVNKKLIAEFQKIQNEGEKVKQSVDLVVSHETCKYIENVKIGDVEISFDDISVYERVQIVNNLPLKLNNKILNYIGSVKKATDKALTFSEEVIVEIDASFLSTD